MKTFIEWLFDENFSTGLGGSVGGGGTVEDSLAGLKFGDTLYLFRGIGGDGPLRSDRVGRWWTTNPFYAMPFGGTRAGRVFVAAISRQDLQKRFDGGEALDVTQDEFPNYGFRSQDPPGARPVTEEEMTALRRLSGDLDKPAPAATKRPGGEFRMLRGLYGQDAIDAVYKVFGQMRAPADSWKPPEPEGQVVAAPAGSHDQLVW